MNDLKERFQRVTAEIDSLKEKETSLKVSMQVAEGRKSEIEKELQAICGVSDEKGVQIWLEGKEEEFNKILSEIEEKLGEVEDILNG